MPRKLIDCNVENYSDFLTSASKCFEFDDPFFFTKLLPHIVPAIDKADTNDMKQNKLLVNDNHTILGTIGVYDYNIVICDTNESVILKAAGIGQVGCLPDARKTGVMSDMLNETIKQMNNNLIDISWLGGDRFRYSNYGYDFSGHIVRYNIPLNHFPKVDKDDDCIMFIPDISHVHLLETMYNTLPSRTIRDNKKWEAHINNSDNIFTICNINNKYGYIVYDIKSNSIIELCGNVSSISKLIENTMIQNNKNEVDVIYPLFKNEISNLLLNANGSPTISPLGLVKICNVNSCFNKLKPFFIKQATIFMTIDEDECEILIDSLTHSEKETICRALLGFSINMILDDRFSFIKPICFFIPFCDKV